MAWRRILCLAAAVPLLTGCSSAEGQEALTLLERANAAQQRVESMTFSMNVRVDAEGRSMSFAMRGGGYAKGPRRGDFFLELQSGGTSGSLGAAAAGLPGGKLRMASIRGRSWIELGGRRTALPGSFGAASARRSQRDASALADLDLTRYVKDVRVDGGHVLNGRAVTKIVGVLDSASLLEQALRLDGTFRAQTGQDIPDLGRYVGDTRVVIYVDERTQLISAALADLEARDDGERARVHLDFAITSVDRPVALPRG